MGNTTNPQVSPFVQEEESSVDKISMGSSYALNTALFTSGKAKLPVVTDDNVSLALPKEKKPRAKKISSDGPIVTAEQAEIAENYEMDYAETTMVLKQAIGQTDALINEVNSDITTIRSSKAMTNKYRYITDLSGALSSLVATKVSAVREINNSITRAIDFNMKQAKELKAAAQAAAQDDDRRIMELYNAFVSAPLGTYQPSQIVPNMKELTFGNNQTVPGGIDVNTTGTPMAEVGYQEYLSTISPTQNMMRYENNPNIQTVVVYDQSTGNKWFDVIDTSTGASVPNVPRPDDFLLEGTRVDLPNMVARNNNIDATYPLIVTGDRGVISEY